MCGVGEHVGLVEKKKIKQRYVIFKTKFNAKISAYQQAIAKIVHHWHDVLSSFVLGLWLLAAPVCEPSQNIFGSKSKWISELAVLRPWILRAGGEEVHLASPIWAVWTIACAKTRRNPTHGSFIWTIWTHYGAKHGCDS
jgi:hypothetical protein